MAGKPQIEIAQGRSVNEWIGKTADSAIPMRVQLRVFERQAGLCALTGKKLMPGEWHCDHIVPLRDGGENRESNLQILWVKKHREKTSQENKGRAKVNRIKAKHFGPRKVSKFRSRGFRKPPSNTKYIGVD